jgi:hypothetical protein
MVREAALSAAGSAASMVSHAGDHAVVARRPRYRPVGCRELGGSADGIDRGGVGDLVFTGLPLVDSAVKFEVTFVSAGIESSVGSLTVD